MATQGGARGLALPWAILVRPVGAGQLVTARPVLPFRF
jgi:hypothetical protein